MAGMGLDGLKEGESEAARTLQGIQDHAKALGLWYVTLF